MSFLRYAPLLMLALFPQASVAAKQAKRSQAAPVSIRKIDYHGWKDALVISNGLIEAVIVPAVNRIMQFRRPGAAGVFWEMAVLEVKAPAWVEEKWMNFGGDKAWPAPQSDWPRIAKSAWPPPTGFDSMPAMASVSGHTIELVGAVDPHYGIRARRLITLAPRAAQMRVTTVFEKVSGEAVKIGVWTITQLKDPERVYVPVKPGRPGHLEGYVNQSKDLPPDLRVADGFVSLSRSPTLRCKIGAFSPTLLWQGAEELLKIDSELHPRGEYPDQGSSAEVYTNPDPDAYVELEMLGPLSVLKIGQKSRLTTTYTLLPRSQLSFVMKQLKSQR
ncbi:MAG: DUF4380 domain-containing protein [Pyrinomonadaceae bacterium]